jgi:hypothetical protein
MASASSGTTGYLLLLAIVVLLIARRMYLMVQGTVFSTPRLIGYAAFYVVFFALGVFVGVLALPFYVPIAEGAVLVVSGAIAVPFVERAVRFERRADGQWYYRLGLLIPAVYLVLFAVRIVIDFVLLNENPFAPPTSVSLTPFQAVLLVLVDTLFAVSTGLLVGRSVGVYRAYQRLPKDAPPTAGAALA